jgi:DNA-binding SARP family transcriptional activator
MDESSESISIIRRALLSRLDCRRLKMIALIAPAGFGKSTLTRQIVKNAAVSVICDCTSVRDDLDLARRILPLLALESPERVPTLTQSELMLGDEAMTAAERVALGLKAWQLPSVSSTFVFENAEHLLKASSAREFLTHLLGSCPDRRNVIICSREDLRLHLSRFAPPHRVVKVRAEDLAFSRDEMIEIFLPLQVDTPTVERIAKLSQGWPIAVFLLARFTQEDRLAELLDKLDNVAFEDLHDYMADQILADLDPETFDALVAAAFIRSANRLDIETAVGTRDGFDKLAHFENVSPFVTRSVSGEFIVHPLVSAMLVAREGRKRSSLLRNTAAAYEVSGDFLRSAELHSANQDQSEAARVLERIALATHHAPSMRYAGTLAAIDRHIIKRHPTLWACSAMLKMYSSNSVDLLNETNNVWGALSKDTPLEKRYLVFAIRVILMSFVGQFDEGLEFVETVAPRHLISDNPDSPLDGYALYIRATLTARLGRVSEAERDLTFALPLVASMDVMGSAVLMLLGADVARTLGQRRREYDLLEQAIQATLPSELPNVIAQRYAEASFGAWLAGDNANLERYSHELARLVEENSIRGFRYYSSRLRKAHFAPPQDADMARWVLCGHLVAYGDAVDANEAELHARSALEVSATYKAPLLRVLALLALAAVSDETNRARLHAEARATAGSIDSPPLWAAVANVWNAADTGSMLSSFAQRRLKQDRVAQPRRLEVNLLEGSVRSGGQKRALTNRELALLFSLAIRPQTVAGDTLVERLWPDLDEPAGRNALYVCFHRLRQRLRVEGAIVRGREGYRLCDEAQVDIWEIQDRVSALRAKGKLSEAERQDLRSFGDRLCRKIPPNIESWDWFAPTLRQIDELRCEVGQRLAKDALERDDLAEAIKVAQGLIEFDPCDEPAREAIIVAHLKSGNRAAALQHYRQYRAYLRVELQCEPSPSITELVRGREPSARLAAPQ